MNIDWLVQHRTSIKTFLREPQFFANPLQEVLGIEFPITTIEECENAFMKVQKFVRTKKHEVPIREAIMCCFALSALHYFVIQEQYKFEIQSRVIGIGKINMPFIISKDIRHKQKSSAISATHNAMLSHSKRDSFIKFYWYMTDIPPVEQDFTR
ncbi:hypothetical protein [Hymenobacter arizonensis]|uniref:Uncharacterized protein n=1 Tax=Hymenobacter arizonensis TaxID=1227077 RepID=A0A1I6BSU8_HYMAR|nr:hypothetical protein [Hymenobacter arizonensis]SFQ83990.1 hypothetical protein SAMN04515668_5060 [Hymenobacter arizonensis]